MFQESNFPVMDILDYAWLIVPLLTGTILLAVPLYREFEQKKREGTSLKSLREFCKSQDFMKPDDDQLSFLQEIIQGSFFIFRENLVGMKIQEAFVKKAGDVEHYLFIVQRDFLRITRGRRHKREYIDSHFFLCFFGAPENPIPMPLFIYKTSKPVISDFLGKKLIIDNAVDDFPENYEVKSIDIRINTISLPEDLQSSLVKYRKDFPLLHDCDDEVSNVYINKKGVSIIATPEATEADLMSLMEVGIDITQASLNIKEENQT